MFPLQTDPTSAFSAGLVSGAVLMLVCWAVWLFIDRRIANYKYYKRLRMEARLEQQRVEIKAAVEAALAGDDEVDPDDFEEDDGGVPPDYRRPDAQ